MITDVFGDSVMPRSALAPIRRSRTRFFKPKAESVPRHRLTVAFLPPRHQHRLLSRQLQVNPKIFDWDIRVTVVDPPEEFAQVVPVGDEVDQPPFQLFSVGVLRRHSVHCTEQWEQGRGRNTVSVLINEGKSSVCLDLEWGCSTLPLARCSCSSTVIRLISRFLSLDCRTYLGP